MPHLSRRSAGLGLAFTSLCCGSAYAVLAKAVLPSVPPAALLLASEALTFGFAAAAGLRTPARELARVGGRELAACAAVGVLASGCAPLLFYRGLAMTSATNATLLAPSGLLCSLALGRWLLGERVTRWQAAGGVLVLVGGIVVAAAGGGSMTPLTGGDALIVLSAQLLSAAAVLFKRFLSRVRVELVVAARSLVGASLVAGLWFAAGGSPAAALAAIPASSLPALVALALFARYLSLTCYYGAMDRLPATTVELIDIAGPLPGVALAAGVLGERVGASHATGAAVVLVGLLVEQLGGRPSRTPVGATRRAVLPAPAFTPAGCAP